MIAFPRCTLYRAAMFGWVREECLGVTVTVKPYAQHAQAEEVRYVPRGARKQRAFVHAGGDGRFVIVEGWGHPEPRDASDPTDDGGTITRHTCYSPEYDREMAETLAHAGVAIAHNGGLDTRLMVRRAALE